MTRCRSSRTIRFVLALAAASAPAHRVDAQGVPSPALIFGRLPNDGAVADSQAPGSVRCTVDAALIGGPALRAESRPAMRLTSSLAGSVTMPLCAHHMLSLTAVGQLQPGFAPFQVDGYLAGATISLPLRSSRAWVAFRTSASTTPRSLTALPLDASAAADSGRDATVVNTMSHAPFTELNVGAARRIGPISLELTAGAAHGIVREDRTTASRIVTDSVWTDTLGWVPHTHEISGSRVTRALGGHWLTGELYASWSHSRFAAGAGVGGWFAGPRMPGVGFGSLELSARVLPNVWVVGAASAGAELARRTGAPGQYSMLGLRFAHAARTDLAVGGGDARAALTIAPVDSSRYLFSMRVPDARQVEMSGEFTHWQPVALARATNGLWVVRVHAAPGAYRMNVRIDGGRWQPPPGTTAVADDFGGSAGIVVLPPR